MRSLVACLTVFLSLGAVTTLASTMAGCSDASDTGTGGASGATNTPAGGASSGGASASAGGACSFTSSTCTGCLGSKCLDQFNACNADTACTAALQKLSPCVCGGTDTDTCEASFYMSGDPAQKLTDCYNLNCTDACQ